MYLNCQFVKVHCVSNRLIKPLLMIFLGGFMATAAAQNYQTNITAASNWLASTSNPRVTLADGAVVDGANSARINPYFANLGVIGWTKDPNHYTSVKNYYGMVLEPRELAQELYCQRLYCESFFRCAVWSHQ